MRNFGAFVYLDLQKTGSKFIGDVLTRFSKTPQIAYRKHGPVRAGQTEGKLHFISCRDPLDQYLSLYSFGCQGKGLLAERLRRAGLGRLHDGTSAGFRAWLTTVLDPANANLLGEGYPNSGMAPLIGFQTFRLLLLSIADPARWLPQCRTKSDILALYNRANLATFYIRTESLRESLTELLEGPLAPYITDAPAAVAHVHAAPALNASRRVDTDPRFVVPEAAAAAVEEREWFFFDRLGYARYAKSGERRKHTDHASA